MATSMQITVQIGGLLADDSTTDYVPGLEPCGGDQEPEPTDPTDLGCFRDAKDDRRLRRGLMGNREMTPDVSFLLFVQFDLEHSSR